MKKWIATAAVILALMALMALPFFAAHLSCQTVPLLSSLPQGQWLEFEGGCGNPTNEGRGLNLDDRREELGIPDEIQLTTAENVRSALDGLAIHTGPSQNRHSGRHVHYAPAGEKSVDYFQYDFQTESGEAWRLLVFEDGCIDIHVGEAPYPQYYHDKGEAYKALDACFASIHEDRAFLEAGKYTVAQCLPQGQWLEFSGEQTVSGQVQPLVVTDTTSEEVRSAFEQCCIRQGEYPVSESENSFRYQFKTEEGQACEIQVFEGGCVLITLDGVTAPYYDASRSVDTYWNLDVRFGAGKNAQE